MLKVHIHDTVLRAKVKMIKPHKGRAL